MMLQVMLQLFCSMLLMFFYAGKVRCNMARSEEPKPAGGGGLEWEAM